MTDKPQFNFISLRPGNPNELFQCLMYIGRVFSDHCWPNLEAVMKERSELLRNENLDLARYTRSTYLLIVMFFSYVDSTALSSKNLIRNYDKKTSLDSLSKKQRKFLDKNDERVTFEELMKIQFSILPHSIGIPIEYGTLKQHSLPHIFKLRKIRNRIVHPSGLKDLIGVDIAELDGTDINTPISDFMHQLYNVLARSALKLVPPENRHKADLNDWLRIQQSGGGGNH